VYDHNGGIDGSDMTTAKRIVPERCCAAIIDVQPFFLSLTDKRLRAKIRTNIANLVCLLDYYKIPIVATLERPVDAKGGLPKEIKRRLPAGAPIFEKNSFDLCKEPAIARRLKALNKKQIIVAGCETDVCILQSSLGLLNLGYEVFVIEELVFSSARNVDAAVARMKSEGVVFSSYKTLYYELMETVEGPLRPRQARAADSFPDDLPDTAA
jgi:nicotinamidase-related amidase